MAIETKKKRKEVLQLPAWTDLISIIEDTYPSRLAKELDLTYSHVVKLIQGFVKIGLVKRQKKGRLLTLTLTEDGKKLKKIVDDLKVIADKHEKAK